MNLLSFLAPMIFIGCPLASIVYFIVCLVRFLRANKANKITPELKNDDDFRELRRQLIISSIIMGVILAVVGGIVALMAMAIAYM